MGSQSGKLAPQVDAKAERRKCLHQWISASTFQDLDEEGLREFKEKSMTASNAKRVDFFLKGGDYDVTFLQETLLGGRDVMEDVDDEVKADEIVDKAKEVEEYIQYLRNKMKPDLNSLFDSFKQDYCTKELKKLM